MKKKPVPGDYCLVNTRDHGKISSKIEYVFGQWIHAQGIRWHFLDDRRSDCVWKNDRGALKIPRFKNS